MASDSAMQGVIPLGCAGDPIELYKGEGRLADGTAGAVRVWVPMRRGIEVRWRFDDRQFVSLGPAELTITHPALGEVTVPVQASSTTGRGWSAGAELGADTPLDQVVVHWVNLPTIPPATATSGPHGARDGRWQVEVDGWELTLDGRDDLVDVRDQARENDEQFLVTHIGRLRRADRSVFDATTAAEVLHGWQVALSFALGRWVAPALPVGFDGNGHRVWEEWAPWRCDPLDGCAAAWWDTRTGDDLAEFVTAFLEAYLDPAQHDEVRFVAVHAIAANHSGTTSEARVMLAQAALEHFAWVRLVLSTRMTATAAKHLGAAGRIGCVLTDAKISREVPAGLPALAAKAEQRSLDGPEVATWVRNRLIHPKRPGEPYEIEGLVWQTSQLLLEYCELLLLYRLGYKGRFVRRYPPDRWAHAEAVPWAPSPSPS